MKRILASARALQATAIQIVALLAFSAAWAAAQSGVFEQKPDELFPVLQLPQVHKELGLTTGQLQKLQAAQDKIEELEEPKDENGDTRELTEEELPRVAVKQNELRAKAIADVLTQRQQNRLRQVLAQIQGPTALMQKSVLAALEVTEEQQKAMLEARKAAVQEMTALREQASDKNATKQQRARAMEKMAAARDAMADRMVAALTPDQQKKWRELVGEKFTLKLSVPAGDPPAPPGEPAKP